MVAYGFYVNNGSDEPDLVGVLPERRKRSKRITRKSIMNLGRLAAGSYVDPKRIYFIRLEI